MCGIPLLIVLGGHAAAVAGKAKLTVWYNERSEPSGRLLTDLRRDDAFRTAVLARYDVHWKHVEPQSGLPIFQVCHANRCWRKNGYTSKSKLARWLGIALSEPQSETARTDEHNRRTTNVEAAIRKLQQQQAELARRLNTTEKTQHALAQNQQRLKDWANSLPLKRWNDSHGRIQQLDNKLQTLQQQLAARQNTTKQRQQPTSNRSPHSTENTSRQTARAPPERSGNWLTAVTAIARLLGFGSAAAAGGWAGIALTGLGITRWLVKRRRNRRQRENQPTADETVPTSASPLGSADAATTNEGSSQSAVGPPPTRIWERPEFTPYETDTFARAVGWAQEQLARKYPGAVGTLTTLNSLVSQYLNSRQRKETNE